MAGVDPESSLSERLRDRAAWLGRHVFPHEPALRQWLRRRPLAGMEIDDIIQETYSRLVAMPSVDHVANPRGYAYQVAGSVIHDHLRRSKVVTFQTVADLDALEAMADEPSPEAYAVDRDELARLARGLALLPERVREVFRLRRIERLPQREVARRLGLSESTVEKHMAKGALLIAEFQRTGGTEGERTSSERSQRARRIYVQGDRSRD